MSEKKNLISVECYGVAWDDQAPECNICDVSQRCRKLTLEVKLNNAKTLSEKIIISPEIREAYEDMVQDTMRKKKEKEEQEETSKKIKELLPVYDKEIHKNSTKKVIKKNSSIEYKADMPNFANMSLEELVRFARVQGIDYNHPDKRILRMQLTMRLKKLYIVV